MCIRDRYEDGQVTWWTFAGLRANLELAARLGPFRSQVTQRENLFITLDANNEPKDIRAAISQKTNSSELVELVKDIRGGFKLQDVLPQELIDRISAERFRDTAAVNAVAASPIDALRLSE